MDKLKCMTISIELEGYEKMKQQLRNLEATLDRILDKQKQIVNSPFPMKSITVNDGGILNIGNSKDHDLLQRIDTDCGRLVRHLGCDKIKHYPDKDICIDGVRCTVSMEHMRNNG